VAIGVIPVKMLPYTGNIGRSTESLPAGDVDVDQDPWVVTTGVRCEVQASGGRLLQRPFGREVRSTHLAFLQPTVDIQEGDLFKPTSGSYSGQIFEILFVNHLREHHIEADMEVHVDHTADGTI
jgi:hypothetical protein